MNDSNALLLGCFSKIQVIGFDLDDTLWDNRPVIEQAVAEQFEVLTQACPNRSREQLLQLYQQEVTRLTTADPVRYQDMTLLRQQVLLGLCRQLGLDPQWGELAFSRFYAARQNFQVYPQALQLLSQLAKGFHLLAISNGNAEIAGTELAGFFDGHWRAGVQGAAKPDADMLLQACAHYGIRPQQLAYVGDNPETDGLAAVNAGCIGILINPDWRNYAQPDRRLFGFNSLTEFSTWLQANRVLN